MNQPAELFQPDLWCPLSLAERRERLAAMLLGELEGTPGVTGAAIGVGPSDRPYDLTAIAETDVGPLRTQLWSHTRASIFCDGSVHPANRAHLAPGFAVREAAERLRTRCAVPLALESRGLTLTLTPEPGVTRSWTAERSRFRGRTAVTREDQVANAGEVDLRDLLAHFYTGPALRLVGPEGPLLLPGAADDPDAPLVSLCPACHTWSEGAVSPCPACGAATDTVAAVRPARRVG